MFTSSTGHERQGLQPTLIHFGGFPDLGRDEKSRKTPPADERRAVIVKAVIDLAASQNPSGISTAAIAKHMNVTQGSLFRYFPNKKAIWGSVMEWVAERLMARIDRSVQGIESPLAAMEAMFISHIEFVAEHPGVPRMMFGELQRAESTPAKRIVQIMIKRYGVRLHALFACAD